MRRPLRWLGTILILGGGGVLAWSLLVWQWQDPFTYLVTERAQRDLASDYEERFSGFGRLIAADEQRPAASLRVELSAAGRRYRRASDEGSAVGRLRIPKIGVDRVVVEGTKADTLKKGPGRYRSSAMPGEGELVYIAGHRTTYGAPFSHIDRLERGDRLTLELPYATFAYEVTGRRIVRADYIQALESRGREEIALQACWPRFFASHRIIVYAKPVTIALPGEEPNAWPPSKEAAAAAP